MIGRALNSSNDLIVNKGQLKLVSDGDEVVQHVRTRLQFYLEEWFLDLRAGTPYFQKIFTKPVNLANIESIIKSRILNTDGVLRLTEFKMDYEKSSRVLNISFSAETEYGSISEEVSLNV